MPWLGTQTTDEGLLEEQYKMERGCSCKGSQLHEQMENDGATDRHKKLQPKVSHSVDEALIGSEIELLYSYEEPDGSTIDQWCQGFVVVVKTQNRVHKME